MRRTVIAGNWKMNMDLEGATALLKGILEGLPAAMGKNTDVVVCPPFTALGLASGLLSGTRIGLGAQNMSQHDHGAFTGEISASMLLSVGCRYVIIGHSERRQWYGETDEGVNARLVKAFASGLIPIMCIGETLGERDQGRTESVITGQVRNGLQGIPAEQAERMILAYEPVWAIGTGKTATPGQAQEVHSGIRELLADLYGRHVSDTVVIQYGGSVKSGNAAELLACKDIDGALVGGACLKAESFLDIIAAAPEV